jgi:hypothetical protein
MAGLFVTQESVIFHFHVDAAAFRRSSKANRAKQSMDCFVVSFGE